MPRVAAVQLTARSIDQADLALEESITALGTAAAQGADLAVLPECTWPAYLLGSDHHDRWPTISPQQVVDRFVGAAREHSLVVVVGLALPDTEDPRRYHNAAVVIDSDGTVVHTARKRFLWDVDSLWFTPGTTSAVVPTSVGRLGVMICADGRMPEIARQLALAGAEILIDPTAWVTAGPDPATWNNAQAIHMFPTRARENGIWSIAANKIGIERDLVAYCGRSCIVAPDGSVVERAPSDAAAVILADISPAPAVFPVARRPDLYRLLVEPTSGLPVVAWGQQAHTPTEASRRFAVSALRRGLTPDDLLLLGDAGVDLVASASEPAGATPALRSGDAVIRTSRDEAQLISADGSTRARWQRTHGMSAPGETIGPLVEVSAGRVGVLLDEDGLVTEAARVLMLQGADLIVWFTGDIDPGTVAATRAAENRVYLLVVPGPDGHGPARIIDPDGNVRADSGAAQRIVSAVVALDETRRKEMAPSTDVVQGRQPDHYRSLIEG